MKGIIKTVPGQNSGTRRCNNAPCPSASHR